MKYDTSILTCDVFAYYVLTCDVFAYYVLTCDVFAYYVLTGEFLDSDVPGKRIYEGRSVSTSFSC